ncbi:MAG: hypothetical protein MZV70_69115 [Desulfobacterales bacterium]|nr:hypothetical protein [Desulfobacterales bacterium]
MSQGVGRFGPDAGEGIIQQRRDPFGQLRTDQAAPGPGRRSSGFRRRNGLKRRQGFLARTRLAPRGSSASKSAAECGDIVRFLPAAGRHAPNQDRENSRDQGDRDQGSKARHDDSGWPELYPGPETDVKHDRPYQAFDRATRADMLYFFRNGIAMGARSDGMTTKRKSAYAFLVLPASLSLFGPDLRGRAKHHRTVSSPSRRFGGDDRIRVRPGRVHRLRPPSRDGIYQRPDGPLLAHDHHRLRHQLVRHSALALAPGLGWVYACGLLLAERFGKAIRHPAKNTLASFAAHEVGPRQRASPSRKPWIRSGRFSDL